MTTEKTKLYSLLFLVFLGGLIIGYSASIYESLNSRNITVDNSNYNQGGREAKETVEIKKDKTNLTAKEAYDLAIPEARLWSSDSYLQAIELASKKFNDNGSSNGWKISFYSKEKNKLYEISIKDGESRGGKEKIAPKLIQSFKGELFDSSKLAESFFSFYPKETEIINLKMYYDSEAKKFLWTIFFSGGSHTIEAEFCPVDNSSFKILP